MSKLTRTLEDYPTTADAVIATALIIVKGISEGIFQGDNAEHGATLVESFGQVRALVDSLPAEVQADIQSRPDAIALLNCNEVLRLMAVDYTAEFGIAPTPVQLLDLLGVIGNAVLDAAEGGSEAGGAA